MMKRHIPIFMTIAAVVAATGFGFASQDLSKGKDEELKAFFSLEKGRERLAQIGSALHGYQSLVEKINCGSNLKEDYGIGVIHQTNIPADAQITVKLQGKDLRSCARIGWEEQNIGFHNLVKYVEGCLEFERYENVKLRLELAKLKGADPSEVERLAELVEQTEDELAKNYLGEEDWYD